MNGRLRDPPQRGTTSIMREIIADVSFTECRRSTSRWVSLYADGLIDFQTAMKASNQPHDFPDGQADGPARRGDPGDFARLHAQYFVSRSSSKHTQVYQQNDPSDNDSEPGDVRKYRQIMTASHQAADSEPPGVSSMNSENGVLPFLPPASRAVREEVGNMFPRVRRAHLKGPARAAPTATTTRARTRPRVPALNPFMRVLQITFAAARLSVFLTRPIS